MPILHTLKKNIRERPKLLKVVKVLREMFRLIPALMRGRHGLNRQLNALSACMKLGRAYGKPTLITIEPTTLCDQKCSICETGLDILGRKQESMSLADFKKILDEFDDTLEEILFYFMGESFLNKNAYKMIRLAADRGIYVSACTNGNFIDPEELVRSGIADIQFQIAGLTQETHEKYRINGKLQNVVKVASEAVRLRDKLGDDDVRRPYPMNIGLGFIAFKHNEHEIPEVHAFAKELGVDEHQIIKPCVRSVDQADELLPEDRSLWIYDEAKLNKGILQPITPLQGPCEWLYTTMTIQVNGDVVPCCRDPKGEWVLGNINANSAYEIWNNKKYQTLRKQVSSGGGGRLCALCEGYSAPPGRRDQ